MCCLGLLILYILIQGKELPFYVNCLFKLFVNTPVKCTVHQ